MKVLIFDVWVLGFPYIQPIINNIKEVEVVFVHLSSLQMGLPRQESDVFYSNEEEPKQSIDFSFYDYDFNKLFKSVRPDLILVLSLHSIEARTICLAAKNCGIKSAFLPHGIFRDSDFGNLKGIYYKNMLKSLKYKLPRLWYYFKFYMKFTYPILKDARIKTGTIIFDFLYFIFNFYNWQYQPSRNTLCAYNLIIDFVLFYSNPFKESILARYQNMVEGADFIFTETIDILKIRNSKKLVTRKGKSVLLISSPPFSILNKGFHKVDVLLNFYADLIVKLGKIGFSIIKYRPHPSENPQIFLKLNKTFPFLQKDLIVSRFLIDCDLIVSPPSSYLFPAVLERKRIALIHGSKIDFPSINFTELHEHDCFFIQIPDDILTDQFKNWFHPKAKLKTSNSNLYEPKSLDSTLRIIKGKLNKSNSQIKSQSL